MKTVTTSIYRCNARMKQQIVNKQLKTAWELTGLTMQELLVSVPNRLKTYSYNYSIQVTQYLLWTQIRRTRQAIIQLNIKL